ncbi:Cytosolic sulfotransferase 15 [Spatholobus suberectus]|nr:Cytosolic sulfotransferase 15 [Spatholobus suberectus]
MAPSNVTNFTEENDSGKGEEITTEEEEIDKLSQECKELILSLPREKGWRTRYIYLFQGFWCQAREIQAIITFQKHFQAKDSDVIVATIPKSGTTWLKALTFAIVNRRHCFTTSMSHPLLTSNPHELVPFLEYTMGFINVEDRYGYLNYYLQNQMVMTCMCVKVINY